MFWRLFSTRAVDSVEREALLGLDNLDVEEVSEDGDIWFLGLDEEEPDSGERP